MLFRRARQSMEPFFYQSGGCSCRRHRRRPRLRRPHHHHHRPARRRRRHRHHRRRHPALPTAAAAVPAAAVAVPAASIAAVAQLSTCPWPLLGYGRLREVAAPNGAFIRLGSRPRPSAHPSKKGSSQSAWASPSACSGLTSYYLAWRWVCQSRWRAHATWLRDASAGPVAWRSKACCSSVFRACQFSNNIREMYRVLVEIYRA